MRALRRDRHLASGRSIAGLSQRAEPHYRWSEKTNESLAKIDPRCPSCYHGHGAELGASRPDRLGQRTSAPRVRSSRPARRPAGCSAKLSRGDGTRPPYTARLYVPKADGPLDCGLTAIPVFGSDSLAQDPLNNGRPVLHATTLTVSHCLAMTVRRSPFRRSVCIRSGAPWAPRS